MFDLKTGAAFSIKSCGGLQFQGGGGVEQIATDAKRKRIFRRGTVNVDNLRERAWMLLLLPDVKEHRQA